MTLAQNHNSVAAGLRVLIERLPAARYQIAMRWRGHLRRQIDVAAAEFGRPAFAESLLRASAKGVVIAARPLSNRYVLAPTARSHTIAWLKRRNLAPALVVSSGSEIEPWFDLGHDVDDDLASVARWLIARWLNAYSAFVDSGHPPFGRIPGLGADCVEIETPWDHDPSEVLRLARRALEARRIDASMETDFFRSHPAAPAEGGI